MTGRRRFESRSLRRRVATRPAPTPPGPDEVATPERPVGICRRCLHHTSAYTAGCTVIVPETLTCCLCDCLAVMSAPEGE